MELNSNGMPYDKGIMARIKTAELISMYQLNQVKAFIKKSGHKKRKQVI